MAPSMFKRRPSDTSATAIMCPLLARRSDVLRVRALPPRPARAHFRGASRGSATEMHCACITCRAISGFFLKVSTCALAKFCACCLAASQWSGRTAGVGRPEPRAKVGRAYIASHRDPFMAQYASDAQRIKGSVHVKQRECFRRRQLEWRSSCRCESAPALRECRWIGGLALVRQSCRQLALERGRDVDVDLGAAAGEEPDPMHRVGRQARDLQLWEGH